VEKEVIAMRRTLSENRFKCLLVLFFVIATWGCVALLGSNVMAANIMKIGMKEEPKTLNIWLANDRWSLRVLSFIYQPLYYRDPETLDQVPWLAEALPVYDQATLSYTVKLRPAKWSDGSELTSEDVAFTGNLIKTFKVPRRNAYWKFIKKIETPDKRTVKFYLKEPMAVFLERTLTTPIVQKKEWVKVAEEAKATEKPLASLLQHKVEKPVASGPFVIKEQRGGAYLYMEKNKYFFGAGKAIVGRKLGPYIDGIIFKYYGTSDAAVLGLKKGSIDMYWWGIEPGYLEDLRKEKDIQLFSNERSALYYMGFNVRKLPFNDPNLRRAIATLVDKDFIITRILQGHGTKMTSIIPPGNRFYYCPDLPTYGDGLSKEERVKKAYDILRNAGYDWKVPPVDRSGKVTKGEEIQLPSGQPMEKFMILTPPADYDPARAMSGMIIQEWLKELGMPASSKPMAFKSLVEQVSVRHDFDAFILGYGRLSLDPDYLRSFFHSSQDKPRGGNKAGYKNPEFDRIADESSRMMDPEKRRELIWEMQKIIMRDVPYVPLYNPSLIEAVRKDKFTGWVQMLEGIGNFWSFCQVRAK
jgi:peptide/nickel transport system substrate-binding protein